MLYFAWTYRAELSGYAWKSVTCRYCGQEYVYRLWATGHGSARAPYGLFAGQAEERAGERAGRSLERKLCRGCEPFPCPSCGHYQPKMVRLLKGAVLWQAAWAGWLAVAAGLLMAWYPWWGNFRPDAPGFLEVLLKMPQFAVVCCGLAVLAFVWWRRAPYDPNERAEDLAGLVPGDDGPFTRKQFDAAVGEAIDEPRPAPMVREE